ncbi:penicillin acylase family protein [Marinospirillum sp. MEB164]|uniref:Penicillin acylase family protein n=1 Tax=Marinospirillum alkalitolerans TaxID=3123374 RepID=A0ABW8PV64_9GAMM
MANNKKMFVKRSATWLGTGLTLGALTLFTSGCSDSSSSVSERDLFPTNGQLEATIRRTTSGVPHITANNLASAAFGGGYAQAQDNVCYLAEAFVKARSERAKYFGPGDDGQGRPINIINDFSYLAQGIHELAEAEYQQLSPASRALVDGFTAGYNQYLAETPANALPPECRNQPWVKPISPADLYAHYRIVGQYASGALFATGALFAAVPGENPADMEPQPVFAAAATETEVEGSFDLEVASAAMNLAGAQSFNETGLGSNAWGLGHEMTEQGRGALLANPHFPYTGHRRLYEVQLTVPGYLNVHGAGLMGTAIPLISFNDHVAWSHTVTTSRRFTLYELTLKDGDPLTYIKDGQERPITQRTLSIQVNMGGPVPVTLERDFYFSEYGPMVSGNAITSGGLPQWGGQNSSGRTVAYTYRDANADSSRLLDTWLAMSRASNLDEFQQVFRQCGTTFWTNTIYADRDGNAYYIDSSSVPNLSPATINAINLQRSLSPAYAALFDAGLTLLDGRTSLNDWVEGECQGRVPFAQRPQLSRTDWVQNANDSYWSTHPEALLEGYSPLFGPERTPLGPRTRLSISMLQQPTNSGFAATAPAGDDGLFNARELIDVIWNNRAWYAEAFLPELRERCALIGTSQVNAAGGARSVAAGCNVLHSWDGVYDLDSVGAHVFRVFIANYRQQFSTDLTVSFDPNNPVATPSTPSSVNRGTANDVMLVALANGLNALDQVNIPYTARLGDVQTYQPSGGVPPNGTPVRLAAATAWHGGDGTIDGAFNAIGVLNSNESEDTRFPRLNPTQIPNTAGLSTSTAPGESGWLIARGTSWHFGLEFTDQGPVAYGLTSYSQATSSDSPFFNDQAQMYSDKAPRRLYFSESDILNNLLPVNGVTEIRGAL